MSVAILARALSMFRESWDVLTSEDEDEPSAVVPGTERHAIRLPAEQSCVVPYCPTLALTTESAIVPWQPPTYDDVLRVQAFVLVKKQRTSDFPSFLVPCEALALQTVSARLLHTGPARKVHASFICDKFMDKDVPLNAKRSIPTRTGIADLCGMKTATHVAEDLNFVAAALHFGQFAWLASITAHLEGAVCRGDVALHSLLYFFGTDTTTLPIGDLVWDPDHRLPECARQIALWTGEPVEAPVHEKNPRAKIHQSYFTVVCVLRAFGRHVAMIIPVLLPLQISDHGNAEALLHCWQECLNVPMITDLEKYAEVTYSTFCQDSEGANKKSSRAYEALRPKVIHDRIPCFSHFAYIIVLGSQNF